MSVGGVSPEVNKFEQVFSDDNQTSVASCGEGGSSHVWHPVGGRSTSRGGVGVGPMSGI